MFNQLHMCASLSSFFALVCISLIYLSNRFFLKDTEPLNNNQHALLDYTFSILRKCFKQYIISIFSLNIIFVCTVLLIKFKYVYFSYFYLFSFFIGTIHFILISYFLYPVFKSKLQQLISIKSGKLLRFSSHYNSIITILSISSIILEITILFVCFFIFIMKDHSLVVTNHNIETIIFIKKLLFSLIFYLFGVCSSFLLHKLLLSLNSHVSTLSTEEYYSKQTFLPTNDIRNASVMMHLAGTKNNLFSNIYCHNFTIILYVLSLKILCITLFFFHTKFQFSNLIINCTHIILCLFLFISVCNYFVKLSFKSFKHVCYSYFVLNSFLFIGIYIFILFFLHIPFTYMIPFIYGFIFFTVLYILKPYILKYIVKSIDQELLEGHISIIIKGIIYSVFGTFFCFILLLIFLFFSSFTGIDLQIDATFFIHFSIPFFIFLPICRFSSLFKSNLNFLVIFNEILNINPQETDNYKTYLNECSIYQESLNMIQNFFLFFLLPTQIIIFLTTFKLWIVQYFSHEIILPSTHIINKLKSSFSVSGILDLSYEKLTILFQSHVLKTDILLAIFFSFLFIILIYAILLTFLKNISTSISLDTYNQIQLDPQISSGNSSPNYLRWFNSYFSPFILICVSFLLFLKLFILIIIKFFSLSSIIIFLLFLFVLVFFFNSISLHLYSFWNNYNFLYTNKDKSLEENKIEYDVSLIQYLGTIHHSIIAPILTYIVFFIFIYSALIGFIIFV